MFYKTVQIIFYGVYTVQYTLSIEFTLHAFAKHNIILPPMLLR